MRTGTPSPFRCGCTCWSEPWLAVFPAATIKAWHGLPGMLAYLRCVTAGHRTTLTMGWQCDWACCVASCRSRQPAYCMARHFSDHRRLRGVSWSPTSASTRNQLSVSCTQHHLRDACALMGSSYCKLQCLFVLLAAWNAKRCPLHMPRQDRYACDDLLMPPLAFRK
jgi:hypothetical protein